MYLNICWFSCNGQIRFELHEPDTEWAVLAAKTDAEQSPQDPYLLSQQRMNCIRIHRAHDLSMMILIDEESADIEKSLITRNNEFHLVKRRKQKHE